MTTHTPAPAHGIRLTDEEITNVLRRLAIRPGDHDFKLGQCIALAIESALLSKLRAPVADQITDHEIGALWASTPNPGRVVAFARALLSRQENAPVADERAALQKLVDLEDMRLRLRNLHEMGHGTDYDYYHKALPAAWDAARAALASAPVADESPMAKMADALREKARQEQQAYQDRRNQATEWGPVAHVAGDEASRYLEWAKDRSAWEMPVGTPVYYSALASAHVAGEAQSPIGYVDPLYVVGRQRGMPWNAKIYDAPNQEATAPLYAAPQASEAARVQQLEAARIAYAREFPPDENGDPDVGNIHANIRKLKSKVAALSAQPGAQRTGGGE